MLQIKDVSKSYKTRNLLSQHAKQILHNISFEVKKGECMGIIGQSGSGKSTLGRLILGIEKPDSGEILYMGKNIQDRNVRRGKVTAVFQDYTSSINPYYTVEKAILEPMVTFEGKKKEQDAKVTQLLEYVGLNADYRKRFPHELSGGEAQRVAIARAIATNPEFILLDEAISSLDASVEYQILVLLKKLKKELNLSYIFITHEIQAVTFLCDRVVFLNDGRALEIVDVDKISEVKDPYSKKLMSSIITL